MTDQDQKLTSPSALRNREPILQVLRDHLPASGTVLEIASGSGEHVVHFASHLPDLIWQPSDPSPEARSSISARIAEEKLETILPPLDLDASTDTWPLDKADAILAINMVHISPWAATEGLLAGAGLLLSSGAPLVLYGPYRQQGVSFVESNVAFDASLKARNPLWGIRQLDDVIACAKANDLALDAVIEMPANNLSVIFRRA
ncbi:DUF938 domain-containing protein [Cohaesibacter intestini]|uniref:DUF938 domain-containing protein n=1 Tax=Cohaesibacter intestini TaxID=2211145 RepID=UPI000DEB28E6|nr:DUF938 domain-containing protein [Cohaesibacter intestini]